MPKKTKKASRNNAVSRPPTAPLPRQRTAKAKKGAGRPDDLLDTQEAADLIGMSHQWLEIGRSRANTGKIGWGPSYLKLGARNVRYRRADILEWLERHLHHCGAESLATKAGD